MECNILPGRFFFLSLCGLCLFTLGACNSVVYDITRSDQPGFTVRVLRPSGQTASTQSLPITYSLEFSAAIDPASLDKSEIRNAGSITGVTWTLTDSGDHRIFRLEATSVSGSGSLSPVVAASVRLSTGDRSVGTAADDDLEVFYYAPIVGDSAALVTTWKTDNAGTSAANQIQLPLHPASSYDFYVDWGDGEQNRVTAWDDADARHTYAASGTYTVTILGQVDRLYFNNSGDRLKILSVDNWGDIEWQSMEKAFSGCANLQVAATDQPDLSQVFSLASMFEGASSFNTDISSWVTTNVSDMSAMFKDATSFNQTIGPWDTSAVTNMASMFEGATSFNGYLAMWNTGRVTNMSGIFAGATAYDQAIDSWNTASVTDMSRMFFGATSFNHALNPLNVGSVINMAHLLHGASSFNQSLANWNTGAVTDMSGLFQDASAFDQSLDLWDVSHVQDFSNMFHNAVWFQRDISNWNTGAALLHTDFDTGTNMWSSGKPTFPF